MSANDSRKSAVDAWAQGMLEDRGLKLPQGFSLQPASDDASFRRYFRYSGDPSFIFVDAPPAMEDSRPFIIVAALLASAGLNVPDVYEHDPDNGFMMIKDFGEDLYFDRLDDIAQIEPLYQDAFSALAKMQQIPARLDPYNEILLHDEMNLFPEWFLARQLDIDRAPNMLGEVFRLMITNATSQPQVFVHRDYHCRNLMVAEPNPGVIDFQDAVIGPITYDLVSLLKDCYHKFPTDQIERWVLAYRARLVMAGQLEASVSETTFMRWFDFMGFQRHLKCAGIFSRLNIRDGKPGYLADIPLVLQYLSEVCERYSELKGFGAWLQENVMPRMNSAEYVRL
ncbi:MAG: phosphotransferase [Pseudomonadales bacterium]|nr:phosphotransferase [Pseudomonadales bacterium]